jgi:hypothetical protein
MEMNHQRLFALFERAHIVGVLQRDGLSPYIQDPVGRVQDDIRALQAVTGMTDEQAIAWMIASANQHLANRHQAVAYQPPGVRAAEPADSTAR